MPEIIKADDLKIRRKEMKRITVLLTCISFLFFFTMSSFASENHKVPFSSKELAALSTMDTGNVDNIKAGLEEVTLWTAVLIGILILAFAAGNSGGILPGGDSDDKNE